MSIVSSVSNVSLALLAGFLLAAAAAAATAPLPDPLEAGWEGEQVCEKLHEDANNRILRCTFPPTVGHERHFHSPNFGYVVAGGRVSMTDAEGTREVELVAGTGSWSHGLDWHEAHNVGETTIVYLIVEPKHQAAR
jgi:beta-alanine degradation protein BauB